MPLAGLTIESPDLINWILFIYGLTLNPSFSEMSYSELEKWSLFSPVGIDIRVNGSMYNIYVADSSSVRKFSVPISEVAENYASPRKAPRIHLACIPSGLASAPDGQWAIVSCSNSNASEILKIDFDSQAVVTIAGSRFMTGGYLDGIGTMATFRYPMGIVVSPEGDYALIAE